MIYRPLLFCSLCRKTGFSLLQKKNYSKQRSYFGSWNVCFIGSLYKEEIFTTYNGKKFLALILYEEQMKIKKVEQEKDQKYVDDMI